MGVPCIESAVRISHPRNTPNISACREMSWPCYQLFRTSVVVEAATWWTYVGEDEVENRPKIKRKVGGKPFCPPYLSQMYGYEDETSQK